MPVLPAVGRRTLRMRIFIAGMYLMLSAGALTMVYPFALMLANSFTSQYDSIEFELVPDYLFDDTTLFAKYIFEKRGLVGLAEEYGLTGKDPTLDAWVIADASGEILEGPGWVPPAAERPGETYRTLVVHGMPDVSSVDVFFGGNRVVEDLKYRQAGSFQIPEGETRDVSLEVRVGGTRTGIGRPVNLPVEGAGTDYVLAITGRPEHTWKPRVVALAAGGPASATGATVRAVNLVEGLSRLRATFTGADGGDQPPERAAGTSYDLRLAEGEGTGAEVIPAGRYRMEFDARGADFPAGSDKGEVSFDRGESYSVLVVGVDDREWVLRQDIAPPEPLASWLEGEPGTPTIEEARVLTGEFNEFRENLPDLWRYTYFAELYNRFDTYVMFQEWLKTQVTFEEVRDSWGIVVSGWNLVFPPGETPHLHRHWPEDDELTRAWTEFKREVLPVHYVQALMLDSVYQYFLYHHPVEPGSERFIRTAAEYNEFFGTRYGRFTDIHLPREQPTEGKAREFYDTFLREWIPAFTVRLRAPDEAYRSYIEERYQTPEEYNNTHAGMSISSFSEIEAPVEPPEEKVARADWQDFMAARDDEGNYACDIDWIEVNSPEWVFQGHLREEFETISDLNAACGTYYASFDEIGLPAPIADMVHFFESKGEIRKTFFTDNYKEVWTYIAGHGRAALNTFILVVATIFTALTVNPMAAYALSRFRLKATNKILLFLLATMAFPAEVGMIPSFLLLKKFHMLNTYWALILPGMAGGFAIFLLKGFFDSLPPELYEAAIIDGAGEWTMFWRITLPLCKPILAVMALGAFGAAYGAFMFAFLVCQKPSMWTLMVFLYQYQQTAPQHAVMASLVIASIPTLLVFIFCQNIILRGIIVPSFK
jgi:ABC-type glycerol-3-phosphate transport system permease component